METRRLNDYAQLLKTLSITASEPLDSRFIGNNTTPLKVFNGAYYSDGIWPWSDGAYGLTYYDPGTDDRRFGSYLKIWNSTSTTVDSKSANVITGLGSGSGPVSSYDAMEQAATTSLYAASSLRNWDITDVSATADTTGRTAQPVGPASIHRITTVPGSAQIFLSYNSQGARVVDLSGLPAQGNASSSAVKEKAFFDFIPTLNYQKSDSNGVPDNYFYCRSRKDSNSSFSNQPSYLPPNYRMGIWDMKADLSQRTHSDENFVYAAGIGEPGTSTEPDNWLVDGGILVLRYFDHEIGGTITGYAGTGTGFNRPYRTVNLQGKFTATRPETGSLYSTIIDTGTTVNLLAGTISEPTALLAPMDSTRTLYVKGTLNVFLKNGNLAYATAYDTGGDVIAMNIVVESNGHLNVKTGAVARFAGNVTVKNGGTWHIEQGATVYLGNHTYTNLGTLTAVGTYTSKIAIKSYYGIALISSGTSTDTNSSTISVGHADITDTRFNLRYVSGGTFTNSFFHVPNEALPGYSCISLFDISNPVTIQYDTFVSPAWDLGNIAIEVNDNVDKRQLIDNDSINGFLYGISLNQSKCSVSNNGIVNCWDGMHVLATTQATLIINNHIDSSTAAGICCASSNPSIVSNHIFSSTMHGVDAVSSAPFLGCNKIKSNHSYGVISGGGSLVNMQVDLFSNLRARNDVEDNYVGQILMNNGKTILLDSGYNYFGIENPNASHPFVPGPPPCATLGALLAVGTGTVGVPPPVLARGNYWGPSYNANPGLRFCPVPLLMAAPPLPHDSCACTDGMIAAMGQPNCSLWSTAFWSTMSWAGRRCDSAMAAYNKDINCGHCDSALEDLKVAFAFCDSTDRGVWTDLFQLIVKTFVECHGRNVGELVRYLDSMSHASSIPENRTAAIWARGMALGIGQYFSTGIALYDSLAALNLATPFDSASAHRMAEMYTEMMYIEGNKTPSGFGKQIFIDKGRAGMQPVGENPIFLEFSPNPFASQANVTFSVPIEDGGELSEIKVYNLLGRDITTLMHEVRPSGRYQVLMDGTLLPAGSYIVAVHTLNHAQSKLIILTK